MAFTHGLVEDSKTVAPHFEKGIGPGPDANVSPDPALVALQCLDVASNVAHVALRQAIVTLQIVHVATQIANVETEDAIVDIRIVNVAITIARGKLHERS